MDKIGNSKLPASLSVYLDLLRVFAALLVMVSHYPLTSATEKFLTSTNFAYDAVVVFFVLSGYVISYAATTLERSLKQFTINRIARIMPVAIAAVLLSAAFYWAVGAERVDLYGDPALRARWPEMFLYALSFTNQAWTNNVVPFGNGPYWSLAFEVWCYAFYALIVFCRGGSRVIAILLLAVLLGSKQVIILPMWLAGSMAYHLSSRVEPKRVSAWLLVLLPVVVYGFIQIPMPRDWSYAYVGSHVEALIGFGLDGAANFGWGYILAILFSLHLFGVAAVAQTMSLPEGNFAVRSIRFLAGYTFTLYLLHMPLIKFFMSIMGFTRSDYILSYELICYALTFICVYVVGNLVEHKKYTYRRWVEAGLDRLIPKLRGIG
ncbi:acyltransferase family protein [Pseudomonas bohemica]|uniref:acyltransferase family protein n=1 Tax=Pseudomonas bohemica TaxID=2044872 RepID=UPI000DA6042C|nr:acyltransferase [Pseudomonas bohemica]